MRAPTLPLFVNSPRSVNVATTALILCLTAAPSGAEVNGWIDVGLKKLSDGSYEIKFAASKIGAQTCELTTPSNPAGVVCPEAEGEFGLSWTGLELSEIQTETAQSWTVVIDEALTTETVAIIDLGFTAVDPIEDSDWLPLPMIANPLDGATGVSPAIGSIDWDSQDFCPNVPNGAAEVNLIDPAGIGVDCDDDLLTCASRSCDLFSPLVPPGLWTAVVENAIDVGSVSGGVADGVTITVGVWEFDDGSWLTLWSKDTSIFNVVSLVPSIGATGLMVLTAALAGLGAYRVLRGMRSSP